MYKLNINAKEQRRKFKNISPFQAGEKISPESIQKRMVELTNQVLLGEISLEEAERLNSLLIQALNVSSEEEARALCLKGG